MSAAACGRSRGGAGVVGRTSVRFGASRSRGGCTDGCVAVVLGPHQPAKVVAAGQAAPIGHRSTGRSRGGVTVGRSGGLLLAEVAVVQRTAVMSSRSTGRSCGGVTVGVCVGLLPTNSQSGQDFPASRSRGGSTDGGCERSSQWPMSWWLWGWRSALLSASSQSASGLPRRPKSRWLGGRPQVTVGAPPEVLVAGQTAVMGSRGTGRGRGGRAGGLGG